MQEVTGLSLIVNPEQSVANEIYMLLKMPGLLRRESFARGQFEIVELKVDQNSVLNGLALNQLPGTVKCKALVCAIVMAVRAYIVDAFKSWFAVVFAIRAAI